MYTPDSFRLEDRAAQHALIRQFSFGTLVSQSGGGIVGTHLPFLLDPDRGPHGTLLGHMARANPQWRDWEDGHDDTEVLAVFTGPHSYVSPAWYEQQRTVPTWNYAAVHAYGRPALLDDHERLVGLVEALTDMHERSEGNPWDRTQMAAIRDRMIAGIRGFEMPIARLEGTVKLNQNLSRADQAGVARAMGESEDPLQRAVAAMMRANLVEG